MDFLIAIKKFQSVFKSSNSKSFHYNLPRIFKTQFYFINKSNPQRVKQKTTVYKARIILGKKKKKLVMRTSRPTLGLKKLHGKEAPNNQDHEEINKQKVNVVRRW